jgi:hypothetical protein
VKSPLGNLFDHPVCFFLVIFPQFGDRSKDRFSRGVPPGLDSKGFVDFLGGSHFFPIPVDLVRKPLNDSGTHVHA